MESGNTQLKYVRKPVELIQCKNKFGLLQRKMYHVLLANAAKDLRPGVKHQIGIGILCNYMKYKSRDYENIKSRFRELRRLDMEWIRVDDNGNAVWTNTSPLSWARVLGGVGVCEYEFTPSLIPYLKEPARWARFSLGTSSDFKSIYGLILFELCEQFKKINRTERFSLEKFRDIMGLEHGEYKDFFALKNRVIKKALAEVNKYWHNDVEAKYEKNGRKIKSIQFIIRPRLSQNVFEADKTLDLDSLQKILSSDFGVSTVEINEWVNKYTGDYIREKIGYILTSSSYKEGKIDSMASYLRSYLKGDFQPPKSAQDMLDKNRQLIEEKKKLEEERKHKQDKIKKEYNNFVTNALFKSIEKLTTKEYERLLAEFWSSIHPVMYKSVKNAKKEVFRAHLKAYILENKKFLAAEIPSFDEYLACNDVSSE